MPSPTTATFWSAGPREEVTRVVLVVSPGRNGIAGAQVVAERLKGLPISAVFCSGSDIGWTVAVLIAEPHGLLPIGVSQIDGQPQNMIAHLAMHHPGQTMVVVAEADSLAMAVSNWLGFDAADPSAVAQDDFAITTAVFHGNRVVLESVNDVCHLAAHT